MKSIQDFPVPKRSVGMWWLGQSGFVFRSPAGSTFAVDLYLSNSCAKLYPGLGINLNRTTPPLMKPEDVDVELYLCTHSHRDHADPETISFLNKDRMRFGGPAQACETFRQCGVREEDIALLYPMRKMNFGDVDIDCTFALPTDGDTDLNHLGYVFSFKGGPTIYLTGDTADHELLRSVKRLRPNVMITCINGAFNNLNPHQAARLAGDLRPELVIPCHHDMMPDIGIDPVLFAAQLKYFAPGVKYQLLTPGAAFVYSVTP